MDLRVEKTLAGIREAYLSLKKGKKISEVKVVDICEKARINKSTFYKYYLDVYDLADKLETQMIDSMLEQCPKADELFTDPEGFTDSMIAIVRKNRPVLRILFDDRVSTEAIRYEKSLLKRYFSQGLTEDEVYAIRFCIGGTAHILSEEESLTPEAVERAKDFGLKLIEKFNFRKKKDIPGVEQYKDKE